MWEKKIKEARERGRGVEGYMKRERSSLAFLRCGHLRRHVRIYFIQTAESISRLFPRAVRGVWDLAINTTQSLSVQLYNHSTGRALSALTLTVAMLSHQLGGGGVVGTSEQLALYVDLCVLWQPLCAHVF